MAEGAFGGDLVANALFELFHFGEATFGGA